jgi:uncharacterized membrane protein YgdD (TMEM256/DUF423 family)
MRGRIFLVAAGLAGAISVATDAIGRHLLTSDAYRFDLATISARYGLIHAAALVGVVVLWQRDDAGFWLGLGGCLFLAGLALFCGSLDLVAFGAPAGLAALTPWGGTAFIAGWGALLVAAVVPRR